MDKIENLRKDIDKIDEKIVGLLEKRVKLAGEIGKTKAKQNIGVSDIGREQKVLENICKTTELDKKFIQNLFKDIIDHCKNLQVYIYLFTCLHLTNLHAYTL